MGEPMQNFVYHTNTNVAKWVDSTSLAQLDGNADQPLDHSPDDFYRSPYHPRPSDLETTPSSDMTSTRQRQQPPSNGTVRSPAKPSVRSVSGPASSIASIAATRAAQLPVNRPTVRSLAQRFNQPSSAESSPPSARVRTARPASSTRSTTEIPAQSASITSSPARPTKEAAYGSYKFNNLKPRERPQPAPASPASVRRTNDRTSRDEQTTPSRRKLSSPTRGQPQRASTGRQPFFGEVVGEHDDTTPGFGIPSAEPSINDIDPVKMPIVEKSTIKLVDDDSHISPKAPYFGHLPVRHGRFPSDMTSKSAGESQQAGSPRQRETRRHSPPSRIPVATRHTSAASDSGSSNRSSKAGSSRPSGDYKRNSPARSNRLANAKESKNSRKPKTQTSQTLPAANYRGYRERGKSPQGAGVGPSLAAVITAPRPPTSPRLRNSRERQLLAPQESSETTIRSVDPSDDEDYFENGNGFRTQDEPRRFLSEGDQMISLLGSNIDSSVESSADTVGVSSSHSPRPEQSPNELDSNFSMAHQQSLTVHTSSLPVPHIPAPLSATTDFEQDESPILGMPGSFMMTPPIAQYTPPIESEQEEPQRVQSPPNNMLPGDLLEARAFRPLSKYHTTDAPDSATSLTAPSELGFRESIPIMLSVDEQQPDWAAPTTRGGQSSRLSIGAHRWRTDPLDSSGTISYLDEDDSPIGPFANRDSLRPEDSASVAFYKQTDHRTPDWTPKMPSMQESKSRCLTMDSEAYSVINKVLNLYHESSMISPEVAYDSQKQIRKVSPVIAQHEDWGSKEATETYLARLLSDATATDERNGTEPAAEETNHSASHQVPSLSIRELDEDPAEHTGGTAIIFPPQSRRYSRGSRGSTTTTIYDEGSRADSSSVNLARDSARDEFTSPIHLLASTYAPHPPLKDWHNSHHADNSHTTGYQPRTSHDRPAQPFGSLLPEIEGAGEGLGLSLQAKQHHPLGVFHYPPPPRPSYSPPPPPTQPSIDQTTTASAPYTPSVYNRQPPSSIIPSAPLPSKMGDHFINSYEVPSDALDGVSGEHPIHHNDTSDPVEPRDPFRASTDAGALQPVLASNPATVPAAAGVTPKDADPVTQALKQRYRVMAELIKTEQLFCVDMMVAYSVFEATSGDCLTDRERRILFCNSQEIDKLSHELYQDLKRAARPVVNPQKSPADRREEREKKIAGGEEVDDEEIVDDGTWDEFKCVSVESDQQTRIGEVMNEHMPQIEHLFTTYLLNHADASNFIKSKSDDGGVLGWVQACFVHSKDLTNAWDLDSLLVKPVQRLMKYPLLLDSLEKATPTDHPDYAAIKAARAEIVEINVRINQAKKRQETLREATKEGKKQKNKGTLETRLGKTFFVKPFSSKVDKSKQPSGTTLAFNDDEYDFLAQKFGGHFFQIQVVMRDINTYLDTMTEFMCNTNCLVLTFVALMESAPSSHPEIESSWRRQAMAFFELQQVALEDHKTAVRSKVQNIIVELWGLHGRPQKLMDQRKKGLATYIKYKQALERKEKIDPKLEDAGQSFIAINTTLKIELPKLYDLTKKCVRACLGSFICLQKEWWKNCQKKILPLLEYEPEHTTSIMFDLKAYVDRFHSDFASVEAVAGRLAIANRGLLTDAQNYASPLPTYVDDSSSSRKSSSRRTESMSSDASLMEPKKRYSGGYSQRTAIPPRSSPGIHTMLARERDRALSPNSERSDKTIGHTRRQTTDHYPGLDGAFDNDFGLPSSMGSSLLSPTSNPGSSRTSGIFNSALPMSSSDFNSGHETAPTTPATPTDLDEPEVLFLAASLFEFNIAHDRREGGIPYLVYVPGEIFDVIGMKGELWLARNQDDSTRTVGWIWEKHFARILPEDG